MKLSNTSIPRASGILCLLIASVLTSKAAGPAPAGDYYTEPSLFTLRPNPTSESNFGCVGVTGLYLRVYPGVVLKVEKTTPGAPADEKFKKGEIIAGVNGVALKGRNPYVALGRALTQAEAEDGKLVFNVLTENGTQAKQVTVTIPVMGTYSKTWPLDCAKSQAIVKNATAFYAKNQSNGVEGALGCLFLLSTGDDQYLPVVKSYFDKMSRNVQGIGNSTWNNGYNGIACGEYYLRTGDPSVLPILQYLCDNARDGQSYGVGWAHSSFTCNPGYVSGGILNSASAQVVTTLLLAKECGVNVDDKTLLGSLKFYYRFAGHGAVPYGDHRPEALESNGKDGMAAAIMQIASEAKGDVDIYKKARNRFAMSLVDSYPCMTTGHGDDGRGDVIWRGITASYLLDIKPDAYHDHMNRLHWWFDLSRRPSGALGISSCQSFDDEPSGAATALAYTAPLRKLRITGAPRSKHAKDFTLPKDLWGRKADQVFLSINHLAAYHEFGKEEPVHKPFFKFGGAWTPAEADMKNTPREEFLKNIHHSNYLIRAQTAKALKSVGGLDELEKLLSDKDPRARRAALDGLIDYKYWFAMGPAQIRPEQVTPSMLAAIRKMLADPEESYFVVDGALMALSCAPPAAIVESLPLILPWTTCDEWWIRQSAFVALADAAEDPAFAMQLLPILREIYMKEGGAQAREYLTGKMIALTKKHKPDSEVGMMITSIFKSAVTEIPIEPDFRAGVGGHYINAAITSSLNYDPKTALEIAKSVSPRLQDFRMDYLLNIVSLLVKNQEKLVDPARQELIDLLYGDYRKELLRRMNAGDMKLDAILSLVQLKDKNAGWHELGTPVTADRVWQFTSFEPQEKNFLTPREMHRFRDVTLPAGLEKWYLPEFDASKWSSGKAPIGKGEHKKKHAPAAPFANQSTWGEGEFLLARTTFELDSLDYDYIRIAVLANQGYRIYLNGHQIHQYGWWADPHYAPKELGPNELKHLKKGTNVIAVYANAAYKDYKVGEQLIGQLDVRVEGLIKSELLVGTENK